MATSALSIVEKLKGRENYVSWKFQMKALLMLEDQWDVVQGVVKPDDAREKDRKALSKISLLIEADLIHHVEKCKTSKDAWDTIQKLFEDNGVTRRVGLLRQLVLTRLDSCTSVEEYVTRIMSTAQRLRDISFDVTDEWIGTLLLAGLPEEYGPMIMGLEGSGIPITADAIKVKLLQDVKLTNVHDSKADSVLFAKGQSTKNTGSKKTTTRKQTLRCYNCDKPGHFAANCKSKGKKSNKIDTSKPSSAVFFSCMASENEDKMEHDCAWYLDSCASVHLTKDKFKDEAVSKSTVEVFTANNQTLKAETVGNVSIGPIVGGSVNTVIAHDVHYMPGIAANLLSVSKITSKGNTVVFHKEGGKVINSEGEVIATAVLDKGVYQLNTSTPSTPIEKCALAAEKDTTLWHRRLAHLNRKSMIELPRMVLGLGTEDVQISNEPCETCVTGKQARFPFRTSKYRASEPLELVHSDICGPMETPSLGGNKYFLTFIDDFSRYTFVYFLKGKDEVCRIFMEFCTMVETQLGRRLKCLRSDNGTEYTNSRLQTFLKEKGIRHQKTVKYTPQQNGVAERANRSITEKARCILHEAGLPKAYWAEAVATAIYLYNRCPTKAVKDKTPFEAWFSRKPNLKYIRIFGCEVMEKIPSPKRKKWDPKAVKKLFIGYCDETKGYRLIDPNTKKVTISRDVVFLEHKMSQKPVDNTNATNAQEPMWMEDKEVKEQEESSEVSSTEDADFLGFETEEKENESQTEPVRRSDRTAKPISYPDFITYFVTENNEPQTPGEALKSVDAAKWEQAMKTELESFVKNDTFEWTDLPKGKKVLKTKWVFRIKTPADNHVQYKARLVVKGCEQKPGRDYEETFAPVIKYSSLRFLLALAVKEDLQTTHMDVQSAYLHGYLTEEVYVQPPEEISDKPPNKVWRLNKAMYGLKQSGRCWNHCISEVLISVGLVQSKADPCLYYKILGSKIIIVAIYVDDVFIFTNDVKLRKLVQGKLESQFNMKNLGEINNCLGMRITRDWTEGKLRIDQSQYIEKILHKFGMSECKPISTPMEVGQKLQDSPDEELCSMTVPYQQAVGSLLYLSQVSRPDISFAVNSVSRFNNCPKLIHWVAVKRIFRYLKGTVNLKLEFNKRGNIGLETFSDADWANELSDRHSISGVSIMCMGGLISWQSKKQRTVALSTVEAEYMALSSALQEVLWFRTLFKELEPIVKVKPFVLYCDNQGTIQLAKNDIVTQKTKHIDVRHHFVKEKILNKEIVLEYLPTDKMISDILTKSLPKNKHVNFVKSLGLV